MGGGVTVYLHSGEACSLATRAALLLILAVYSALRSDSVRGCNLEDTVSHSVTELVYSTLSLRPSGPG